MPLIEKNKYRFSKLKALIVHYTLMWKHKTFNSVVIEQLKNPKTIPIIIISFNQLKYLEKLINVLQERGYNNIIIIDNNSTYKPLLNYFEMIKDKIIIHKLDDNLGHLSFWKSPDLFNKYAKGYYVVTDADVVPVNNCPDNFIEMFITELNKSYMQTKVGFSLKLDDIPDTNVNKKQIVKWESKYWNIKTATNIFKAEIDTTFALYKPKYRYKLKKFIKAKRFDYPLQARHGGWYVDTNNLTEEQEYYIKTANTSASWITNKQGDLINETHKPLYDAE